MSKSYFNLKEKNTSVRIEIMAGITTFLTMAYIIFVNPSILAAAGMDQNALVAVTCIVSAISTILVGIFARAPIAMAPGMGLNAFFAYTLVIGDKLEWQTALGVVFLSGMVFLILTFLGLRRRLVEAIPMSLVSAMAVGIGLFITFIGLQNLGLIVNNDATLVSAGKITGTVLIGLAGLAVMVFLEAKKIKGSLLIGIIFATLLAVIFGQIQRPEKLISLNLNIAPAAFKLNILAAFKLSFLGSIFTLMFIDMFDSIGTLVACCHQAKMVDEKGQIKGLDRLLAIDAFATMLGAVLGTSTTTSYIESATGIEQGGRTGIASIVTGAAFLLALPFVPLVGIVPTYATAPALIMVGLFMIREIKNIDFLNIEEGFPAFIIMVMIALSYSISTGLAFGFVSFVIIKIVLLKVKEIKPAMWIIGVLCLLFLTIDQIPALIEHFKG
ncbi:MAG: NCS2 family permease [Sedimentisphaerales bacterium]|nr:NCS2 family permease [Sedimentisphaerales bacterium]